MQHALDTLRQNGAKRPTLASTVYERLRADILKGLLLPGNKLRIDSLRLRYNVGASPVREALNRLVAEGFVVLEDQKGFRVAPVSLADLEELTRTRCLINEIAIREAIQRGDEAWEERIVLAFHRMIRAVRKGAPMSPERSHSHRAFHAALIDACGSHWIIDFSETLFDCAGRYQGLSMNAGGRPRDVEAEHRPIMEAVLARNIELSIELLNKHVSLTADIVANLDVLQGAEDG